MPTFLSNAWARLNLFEKFCLVVNLAGFICMMLLPDALLSKIGMGRKDKKNPAPTQITANIWQIPYWEGQSNCTIIKGKDGTLLLHSACEDQPHTVEQLAKLGPVGAIIFPSLGHDTYHHVWKNRFPEAKVYCPKEEAKEISRGVPVDGAIEESIDALANWGIKGQISCNSFQCFGECALLIETQNKDEKINAVLGVCAMGNKPRSLFSFFTSPRQYILGFLGLGIYRMFALMWITDLDAARSFLNELGELPDVSLVLFQHGLPLTGKGANTKLKTSSKCSRSIFVF